MSIGRNKYTPPADGHVPGRRNAPRLPEPFPNSRPYLLGRGQFGAKPPLTRLPLSPKAGL